MSKLAPVALFVLVACGSASRVGECEVEGCDALLTDSCVTSVEACETAGGDLQDTCVDLVIDANDLACSAGGTTPKSPTTPAA